MWHRWVWWNHGSRLTGCEKWGLWEGMMTSVAWRAWKRERAESYAIYSAFFASVPQGKQRIRHSLTWINLLILNAVMLRIAPKHMITRRLRCVRFFFSHVFVSWLRLAAHTMGAEDKNQFSGFSNWKCRELIIRCALRASSHKLSWNAKHSVAEREVGRGWGGVFVANCCRFPQIRSVPLWFR